MAVVVDARKRALAEEDHLAGREAEVVVLLKEWMKENWQMCVRRSKQTKVNG